MITNNSLEHGDARLIDTLIDGELPESQRADLLRRLDQSPQGWRQLSLAFLEAHEWRQGLHAPRVVPEVRVAPLQIRRRTFAWVGTCVVSALLAFALGLLARGQRLESSFAKSVSLPPTAATNVSAPDIQQAAMAPALTPAARQQLERLGFRVQERPRVVSVQRLDGQTVQVLVNEVELHFVGRPYSL